MGLEPTAFGGSNTENQRATIAPTAPIFQGDEVFIVYQVEKFSLSARANQPWRAGLDDQKHAFRSNWNHLGQWYIRLHPKKYLQFEIIDSGAATSNFLYHRRPTLDRLLNDLLEKKRSGVHVPCTLDLPFVPVHCIHQTSCH